MSYALHNNPYLYVYTFSVLKENTLRGYILVLDCDV